MKKQTGKSILRAQEKSTSHYICKENSWYSKTEIMEKLNVINPLYTLSDQSFYYWIRLLYKGTFKQEGLTKFYQGKYLNPVLDTYISFKQGNRGE